MRKYILLMLCCLVLITFSGLVSSCKNTTPTTTTSETTLTSTALPQYKWSRVYSPPANVAFSLNGIWGSSANDIFAVGAGGTILHFDGTTWQPTTADVNYYVNIDGIWGGSPSPIFAVGGDTILQFTNGAWQTVFKGPGEPGKLMYWFQCIAGSSANNIYAGGPGVLAHYDGTAWNVTVPYSPDYKDISAIYAVSPSNIFSIVSSGNVILNNWQPMDVKPPARLNAIWGSSPTDVFAVGVAGMILHYDGSAWKSMTNTNTYDLNCVWGSSPSDVFAAGQNGTILHYDGHSWSNSNHASSGISDDILGMWGSSASDVYAVGSEGILRYSESLQ